MAKRAFQTTNRQSWWKSGFPLHTVECNKIATDGSLKNGRAGWGMACSELALFASLDGRQAIDLAEATALMAAISLVKKDRNVEMVIDSQSTIDMVNIVLDQTYNPKGYRKIANYSIIKTIVDEIHDRRSEGFTVELVKVKSHTGALDVNSLLNEEADKAADLGRMVPSLIGPCLHNLPRAYLGSERQIWETKTHSEIYKRMDEFLLHKELGRPRASGHLKLWDLADIWHEANFVGKDDKIKMFRCKMFCKSLPTPRNIQVLNMRTFPNLYPHDHCPLCEQGEVGEDFHIFCKCPTFATLRQTVAHDCKNAINTIINAGNDTVSLRLINFCLFP